MHINVSQQWTSGRLPVMSVVVALLEACMLLLCFGNWSSKGPRSLIMFMRDLFMTGVEEVFEL